MADSFVIPNLHKQVVVARVSSFKWRERAAPLRFTALVHPIVLASSFSNKKAHLAISGGVLMGLVTQIKLLLNGNILGISGIVGGLTRSHQIGSC